MLNHNARCLWKWSLMGVIARMPRRSQILLFWLEWVELVRDGKKHTK